MIRTLTWVSIATMMISGCSFFAAPKPLSWMGLENSKILITNQNQEVVAQNLSLLKASNDSDKVEVVVRAGDEKTAELSYRSLKVALLGAFRHRASPYAGKVSRKEACAQQEKLPKPFGAENPTRNGFIVKTNAKGEAGLCDPENLTHVLLKATIHCRELNRVFEVKILKAKDTEEKLQEYFQAFRC